jgi:hypothetical protein
MAKADWRTTLRDSPVITVKVKNGAQKKTAAKKKKERYSPGVMYSLGVAERRVLRGLAEGAKDYLERSSASAEAHRDGALRDLVRNAARAQQTVIKQLAKIPKDITKSPEVKRGAKRVRSIVRIFAR